MSYPNSESMKLATYFFVLIAMGLVSCNSKSTKESDNINTTSIIPIYIEPYYNSNPFKINVGEYSEQLKTTDEKQILETAQTIKTNIDKVNVETLFVLSNRLYDLKQKDEAVYWYYTASFRRNVFKQTAIDNNNGAEIRELTQAFDAYRKLLGEYVNGYAFGDIDKNIEICREVIKDNAQMKSLSTAYPEFKFDDTKLEEVVKDGVIDREKFILFMKDNREDIKKQRIENGIENKY